MVRMDQLKTPEAKEKNRLRIIATQKRLRKEKQDFVRDYKAKVGCSKCGERDPIVLELHHMDPVSKNPRLKRTDHRRVLLNLLGWDAIAKELQLCTVLCANCHRRLEYDIRMAVVGDDLDEQENDLG